jgi:SAM-dependent methyltransferase
LGRIAVQLSRFLNNDGRYEGFDIIEEVVAWCKNHITAKYPNFNFFVADIYNGWYNSSGKFQPYEYKFPYTDSSFDFVIAFSVFTHMFYKEMENYFREISRVLKKGGQCWLTFTILDDESLRCLESKITLCDFNYKFNGYRSTRNDNPEASIAWEEGIIRRLCKEYELSIKEPIIPGSWRGIKRETPLWQDIIIVSRN